MTSNVLFVVHIGQDTKNTKKQTKSVSYKSKLIQNIIIYVKNARLGLMLMKMGDYYERSN